MVVGTDESGAVFDASAKYRYLLWRIWDFDKPIICWFLLNPSTADEIVLDPTLRRCKRYSELWGYGGFKVLNVFSFRTTKPKNLLKCKNPIGPTNDYYIIKECLDIPMIVVGWGNFILNFWDRIDELNKLLYSSELYALKLTSKSQPSHPLYLKKDLKPFLYKKMGENLKE